MTRFILCLFSLLIMSAASAGVYEDALKQNERVFLYIYTKRCGYCIKFNPLYEKLATKYGSKCKFIKIDGDTVYGRSLSQAFSIRYVPYVAIINSKFGESAIIPPNCLLHFDCSDEVMRSFVN